MKRILYYLQNYKLNKQVLERLHRLSPAEAKKTDNLTLLLEAIGSSYKVSEGHFETIRVKSELGVLCKEIEEFLPGCHVGIFFWSAEENALYHGAGPSIPIDFFDILPQLKGKLSKNCTACGKAIFTDSLVVSCYETSPEWEGIREFFTEKFGYKSCWSIPFHDGDVIAGTFGVYSKESNIAPTKEQIELLKSKIACYEKQIKRIALELKRGNPAIVEF